MGPGPLVGGWGRRGVWGVRGSGHQQGTGLRRQVGGVPWSGAEGEGGGVWVVDFGLGRRRG